MFYLDPPLSARPVPARSSKANRGHDSGSGRYTRLSALKPAWPAGRTPKRTRSRGGAAVFENSTACTLFDRTLDRDCVSRFDAVARPRLLRERRFGDDGARLTPSRTRGPACVLRASRRRLPLEDARRRCHRPWAVWMGARVRSHQGRTQDLTRRRTRPKCRAEREGAALVSPPEQPAGRYS